MILNGAWKQNIADAFDDGEGLKGLFSPIRNNLLETIWQISKTSFDEEREVQVVIDNENTLFIGVGSGSFVSFDSENIEKDTMKVPLKCWIHTHPFGQAYFSSTDRMTLNAWKPLLYTAIVIGDGQHEVWFNVNGKKTTHYQYKTTEKEYDGLRGEEE